MVNQCESADMKLGLLVMLAVAVLLPSFSESRIVSKCELREKLGEMLHLPGGPEERTLATVICEVERRSGLNTSLVKSFGKCIPTTPKPTLVTAPSTAGGNKMTTGAATAANSNSTTTDLTNTTTATNISIIPTTANSTISSGNTTFVSNSTSGIKRRRRDADSSSEKENKFSGEEKEDDSEMEDEDETSSEEEQEDDDELEDEDEPSSEEEQEDDDELEDEDEPSSEKEEDDSEMEDEDETSSEEDAEPKNLYGLFQLSDRKFCNSGNCPSKNLCHTSCMDFTDEDITDDIACLIETDYWEEIMRSASESCRGTRDFFEECN